MNCGRILAFWCGQFILCCLELGHTGTCCIHPRFVNRPVEWFGEFDVASYWDGEYTSRKRPWESRT